MVLFEGFSYEEGTKPGFSIKNDSFSVRFESIQIEESANVPVEFTVHSKDEYESSWLGAGHGDDSWLSWRLSW